MSITINNGRKNAVQSVFTVKSKEFITPHYIRIIFYMTTEQLRLFGNVRVGAHNKISIANGAVRTYTTRHIDEIGKELWIDFVAHGDNGPASYWAQHAGPGDTLSVAMKEGNRPLIPEANEYLLVGDITALPVIGVILEQLPAGVRAKAIIEIYGQEDELNLTAKTKPDIQWVYNPSPETGSSLYDIVRDIKFFGSRPFVFIAAEYDTVKNLKAYFREELGWPQHAYSITSYWKRGESEDESSSLRREERRS